MVRRPGGTVAMGSKSGPELRVQTAILCALVLCVQLVPSLPFYFGWADSLAAGMVVAAAFSIRTGVTCWAIRAPSRREGLMDASAGGLAFILTTIVLIAIHGVVADQMQRINARRFVESLAPLILLLGSGLALGAPLRAARPSQIVFLSWMSFWAMCVIIALRFAGLQPRAGDLGKSTFPFNETSHFALAFGPVFLYRCASARARHRDFWVLLGFALALMLRSGTLLAVAFIGALVGRRFLICLLVAIVAVAVVSADLRYFTSRADISSKNKNLSALVYLEGWEMLGDSLVQSDGWGVGFQQLGVHGSDAPATRMIERITGGGDLNITDGSFVMSKFGSEFGVAGLLLVMLYCVLALKSLLLLRAGRGPPGLTLLRSIIVAYGVDMFVRGTGYFSQSSLLFVGALFALAPVGGLLRMGRSPAMRALMVFR